MGAVIDDQEITVAASNYSPVDETGLTNGIITPLNADLDMRQPRKYAVWGGGNYYNYHWVLLGSV